MIVSEIVIIVMFVLMVASIIGNTAFIGLLYVSIWNAERIVEYKRKQQDFEKQKERVEKTIHGRRH